MSSKIRKGLIDTLRARGRKDSRADKLFKRLKGVATSDELLEKCAEFQASRSNTTTPLEDFETFIAELERTFPAVETTYSSNAAKRTSVMLDRELADRLDAKVDTLGWSRKAFVQTLINEALAKSPQDLFAWWIATPYKSTPSKE